MVKKIDSRNIRENNRKLIYHYIMKNGPVSRQDIVSGLHVSLPTVTRNLESLMEGNWIQTAEAITNTGGRNAAAYEVNERARMAVGVSLTGHHINVISMDLKGTVLTFERMRRQFDLGCDGYIHSFSEMVKKVLKKDGITGANCLGVGISLPGLLSEDHKKVIYGKTFGFTGVTYEEITRYLQMPGQLFHDTYTSGYAEARARRDIKNAFYLILGVSVGGAVIVGRRVYEGDSGKAGEIGHILADRRPTAKRCYCGRKGCFDTLCRSSELDSYTDGNLEAFFQKLSEGDEGAEKRWKDYAKNLAVAVNNVHLLFDMPVILGGYVGMYMKEHIRDIRGYVDAFNPFGEEAEKYVLSCCSRLEPIAEGSARVYIDQFLENSSFE